MAYLSVWRDPLLPIRRGFRAMWQYLPADCPLCGCAARGGALCGNCRLWVTGSMGSKTARCQVCCLALDQQHTCPDCAKIPPAFDQVVAAFDYAEPGDLLIHRLKVRRDFFMANVLANMLAQAITNSAMHLPKNATVVCVPASRAAIVRRGFNPAAEIARCLADQLGLAYQPQVLRRAHEGHKQASLNRAERTLSVQALYQCTCQLDGMDILVVDDVMTTGSTLNSIAHQLRLAGAARVFGLVVARTPCR